MQSQPEVTRGQDMRVVLVSFNFGENCIRLASALSERVDIQLLLPEEETAPNLPMLSRKVRLRTFDKPRLRQMFRQAWMVAALVRQIRRFRPDVIHVQAGHLWF